MIMILTVCFFALVLAAIIISFLLGLPLLVGLALVSHSLDLVVIPLVLFFVFVLRKRKVQQMEQDFKNVHVDQPQEDPSERSNEENNIFEFFDFEVDALFCNGIDDETDSILVDVEFMEDVDIDYFEAIYGGEDTEGYGSRAHLEEDVGDLVNPFDRSFQRSLTLATYGEGLEDITAEGLFDTEIVFSIDEEVLSDDFDELFLDYFAFEVDYAFGECLEDQNEDVLMPNEDLEEAEEVSRLLSDAFMSLRECTNIIPRLQKDQERPRKRGRGRRR